MHPFSFPQIRNDLETAPKEIPRAIEGEISIEPPSSEGYMKRLIRSLNTAEQLRQQRLANRAPTQGSVTYRGLPRFARIRIRLAALCLAATVKEIRRAFAWET